MIFLLHEQREEDNRIKIHSVNGRKRFPSTSRVFVFFFFSQGLLPDPAQTAFTFPDPQSSRFPCLRSRAVRCLRFINQENPAEVKLCGVSVGSGCNPMLQEMEVRNGEITLGGIMKEPSHSATFTGTVL